MNYKEVSQEIVSEIVSEIKLRSGLNDDWNRIPQEVKVELINTFIFKASKVLEKHQVAEPSKTDVKKYNK